MRFVKSLKRGPRDALYSSGRSANGFLSASRAWRQMRDPEAAWFGTQHSEKVESADERGEERQESLCLELFEKVQRKRVRDELGVFWALPVHQVRKVVHKRLVGEKPHAREV